MTATQQNTEEANTPTRSPVSNTEAEMTDYPTVSLAPAANTEEEEMTAYPTVSQAPVANTEEMTDYPTVAPGPARVRH
jgi:hypothetical protein